MKNQSNQSIVLLRGAISGLERSRRSHNFVLSQNQHQQIGATAIAASAMDMGATGIGLVNMSENSNEEADWVEFNIDNKKIRGWLWMMPMRNGDIVEIVAESTGEDHYLAYAVKRDGDDLVAVYPHATAGRKAHYRKSAKIWLWSSLLAYSFPLAILVTDKGFGSLLDPDILFGLLILLVFCMLTSAIIAFRISRKFMKFVRTAELIFKTFGWTDIENIDLRKTSIENMRENTLPNFGTLYFRYK
jgi:hypothetical protein